MNKNFKFFIDFCKGIYDYVNLIYPVVVVIGVFGFFGNIRHPLVVVLFTLALVGAAFYSMEVTTA